MAQTAFGYEQEDGYVRYVLTRAYSLDELFEFMSKRHTPHKIGVSFVVNTLEEYFSIEKENTIWRVVYLLDGTALCRHISTKGDILYRSPV